ncbi:hypothetical protein BV898_10101 [Hypsibius exemplaris]|uniref:Uncharacterized protein n=1 Tax=Hypsibius exemplaris TaxID=2072580 RepID=A0A1W0WKN5_HYPEX|nr:hypothetical protein BV898_10101 [Hypsibius exemplaris]
MPVTQVRSEHDRKSEVAVRTAVFRRREGGRAGGSPRKRGHFHPGWISLYFLANSASLNPSCWSVSLLPPPTQNSGKILAAVPELQALFGATSAASVRGALDERTLTENVRACVSCFSIRADKCLRTSSATVVRDTFVADASCTASSTRGMRIPEKGGETAVHSRDIRGGKGEEKKACGKAPHRRIIAVRFWREENKKKANSPEGSVLRWRMRYAEYLALLTEGEETIQVYGHPTHELMKGYLGSARGWITSMIEEGNATEKRKVNLDFNIEVEKDMISQLASTGQFCKSTSKPVCDGFRFHGFGTHGSWLSRSASRRLELPPGPLPQQSSSHSAGPRRYHTWSGSKSSGSCRRLEKIGMRQQHRPHQSVGSS